MDRGEQAFDRVVTYADLGDHRTGTAVDSTTAQWVADELSSLGLHVALEAVEFEQWTATSRLLADGRDVAHLPVFHEWTGSLHSSDVHVASFDPRSGGYPRVLEDPIAKARAAGGDAAVLATEHPNGSLVAVNRELDGAVSGFPTVLVAGRDHPDLVDAAVELSIDADIGPGTTSNIVAGNGKEGVPLLLTTPLTGWFGCAGERGTGIAVLLDLAERLSDRPLLVVATGGHELGCFGAHRFVRGHDLGVSAIVHIGASVAVDHDTPQGRELVPTRLAMTSLPATVAEPIAAALAPAALDLAAETSQWIGEGAAWCDVGAPMLSITGAGVDFHTPDDRPGRVTSADSLVTVAEAIGSAAVALDDMER